jgi:hypothetical protein
MKSRMMGRVRHVACKREIRNEYKVMVEEPDGKNHLEDVHGRCT